jgi:hypothetical protein
LRSAAAPAAPPRGPSVAGASGRFTVAVTGEGAADGAAEIEGTMGDACERPEGVLGGYESARRGP